MPSTGQTFALIKIAEMVRGFLGEAILRGLLSTKSTLLQPVQDTVATVEAARATWRNAAAKGEQAVAGAAAKDHPGIGSRAMVRAPTPCMKAISARCRCSSDLRGLAWAPLLQAC